MLENAETSFPLLKISRSAKLLRRRDIANDDNSGSLSIHISQTPKPKQSSFLPPINQNQSPGAGAYAKMMESKKNRMNNFSRSLDKPSIDRPNNNGVGYYTGPKGPNIVVTKISQNQENNTGIKPVESTRYLR